MIVSTIGDIHRGTAMPGNNAVNATAYVGTITAAGSGVSFTSGVTPVDMMADAIDVRVRRGRGTRTAVVGFDLDICPHAVNAASMDGYDTPDVAELRTADWS
jgi:hypothetical protein